VYTYAQVSCLSYLLVTALCTMGRWGDRQSGVRQRGGEQFKIGVQHRKCVTNIWVTIHGLPSPWIVLHACRIPRESYANTLTQQTMVQQLHPTQALAPTGGTAQHARMRHPCLLLQVHGLFLHLLYVFLLILLLQHRRNMMGLVDNSFALDGAACMPKPARKLC
jgi:hypothetical protein